jgi:hypothetical protein
MSKQLADQLVRLYRDRAAIEEQLRARIAQFEEALKAYLFIEQTNGGENPHSAGSNAHRALELARAALSSPDAGVWLEEQRRLAKAEAIEMLPCYPCDDCGASDCKMMHETSDCPRCAALAELRGGRG